MIARDGAPEPCEQVSECWNERSTTAQLSVMYVYVFPVVADAPLRAVWLNQCNLPSCRSERLHRNERSKPDVGKDKDARVEQSLCG
jgi:hypothetical protein